MKFFDMLDESTREKIRLEIINACTDALKLFFFPPGVFKPQQMTIWTITEGCVERVFQRYGFNSPHSATSVSHNIMADHTEKEAHQRRVTCLSNLIAAAKVASAGLFELGQAGNNRDGDRTRLDFAIAAVEKEFKQ